VVVGASVVVVVGSGCAVAIDAANRGGPPGASPNGGERLAGGPAGSGSSQNRPDCAVPETFTRVRWTVEAPVGQVQTRMYRKGVVEDEGFPLADVSEHLEEREAVVWVDLCGPNPHELHELATELGLHELAVEDALGPHQRPKLDHYATHLFLSCHAVQLDRDSWELIDLEVDAFVGDRWLITVRDDDQFPMNTVVQRWDRSPELAVHGVSFLLYGLLDVVVDGYFDVVRAFDEYYDEISESIFDERPLDATKQRDWFHMRRALVKFNRLVAPTRETVSALLRREQTVVVEDLYPYYQDVYDHVLRVSEATDSLRELVATIVETNLSLRDYRQNQIVKKVSSWAAIIAVPAAITGYYGMNVPYPGSGDQWGFILSSVLLVVASFSLYLLFRWRNWL
jgi:magnesium transporter